jgi:hypothetical protein
MRLIPIRCAMSMTVPEDREDIAWGLVVALTRIPGVAHSYTDTRNPDGTITREVWISGRVDERHAPTAQRPQDCKVAPWVEPPATPPERMRERSRKVRTQRRLDMMEYNEAIVRGELDPESVSFEDYARQKASERLTMERRSQDRGDKDVPDGYGSW